MKLIVKLPTEVGGSILFMDARKPRFKVRCELFIFSAERCNGIALIYGSLKDHRQLGQDDTAYPDVPGQKTGETPISLTILEARWRLFGHILRQAINTPPNVAITKYFKTEEANDEADQKHRL
ncbi:hypothetical protein ElyMa_001141400 [Elysia marginata]|uniref:Uncharacterized protein n=1 Tax=Elysia marginata TaxID=1093978 RepID=A0AAV4I273_9GAST|nr:hypothetical protein ElyMa_001141400 [Elysia marginata]